ncbi:hypothetical protein K0M31_001503 [Melipona bicolor]|uniref:Uncharacterized protein n=1 Tax=Melipona bicolor TaxID=60889 RepID=A0AA40GGU6_9HYME|nr:hypothetical protein K0M31_001503 [Melipona bicolor]
MLHTRTPRTELLLRRARAGDACSATTSSSKREQRSAAPLPASRAENNKLGKIKSPALNGNGSVPRSVKRTAAAMKSRFPEKDRAANVLLCPSPPGSVSSASRVFSSRLNASLGTPSRRNFDSLDFITRTQRTQRVDRYREKRGNRSTNGSKNGGESGRFAPAFARAYCSNFHEFSSNAELIRGRDSSDRSALLRWTRSDPSKNVVSSVVVPRRERNARKYASQPPFVHAPR